MRALGERAKRRAMALRKEHLHVMVGDPAIFAIESEMTVAYDEPSIIGIGFFIVHVDGQEYGVRADDATALALPLAGCRASLKKQGAKSVPFSLEPAREIAAAYRNAIYSAFPRATFFGLSRQDFSGTLDSGGINDWGSFADEAFDDGSYLLPMDDGDRVRVIAFRSDDSELGFAPDTLADISLAAVDYYQLLEAWCQRLEMLWRAAPKIHS
jgi:hypothetical protein